LSQIIQIKIDIPALKIITLLKELAIKHHVDPALLFLFYEIASHPHLKNRQDFDSYPSSHENLKQISLESDQLLEFYHKRYQIPERNIILMVDQIFQTNIVSKRRLSFSKELFLDKIIKRKKELAWFPILEGYSGPRYVVNKQRAGTPPDTLWTFDLDKYLLAFISYQEAKEVAQELANKEQRDIELDTFLKGNYKTTELIESN
jgi:hypothetical protein